MIFTIIGLYVMKYVSHVGYEFKLCQIILCVYYVNVAEYQNTYLLL